jgi:oligogalacturonide transporter
MLTAGFLYLFSWERNRPGEALPRPGAGGGALGALKALYRNLFSTMKIRAFRLHLGMYLGGYISQDIFNAAFTFFVIFALAGTTAIASGLLGTLYIVQLVAVIIAINLALRSRPASPIASRRSASASACWCCSACGGRRHGA